MRVAFHSPLPPAGSGIADYAAALLGPLSRLVDVETNGDPARGDVALYQIGNNADHIPAYEAALRHPGVVVLHEANLHHLIAELTIRRGDWDAYMQEVEFDGGAEATAYAQRVRALEIGPDYEGVPMLRRLLGRTRGLIVHSEFVKSKAREAGYGGPIAVIPHGAWLPQADRMDWRTRLGVNESDPLIGVFGHLKPYKRIPQALRAFARVVRHSPESKMILVGEEHPETRAEPVIRSLRLDAQVRRLGRADEEAFVGYMSACDIVLNLRFPTAGETSGTLLRALGLGRAVIVSDVGAFAELPGRVCLRVPVDSTEEDLLYEYLHLLVSQPEFARALGAQAKQWAAAECSWESAARRYAEFLQCVASGSATSDAQAEPDEEQKAQPTGESIEFASLEKWAAPESREYVRIHQARLIKTLEITPRGSEGDQALEMGAYMQITPLLKTELGYGEVRGCYYGAAGQVEHKRVATASGEVFECDVDLFDAERDRFPYEDERFATVICGELIEHLTADPMHMMAEINRILKPGGHLVLTTPNAGSARAIAAILHGHHPGFFPAYIRPPENGARAEARHNREYTPKEIHVLLEDAGFEVARMETGEFYEAPRPEHIWVEHLLRRYWLSPELRGDGVYAVGRKATGVRRRWPEWLYS